MTALPCGRSAPDDIPPNLNLETTMLPLPFEVLSCSWPAPVDEVDGRWVSAPRWDAPAMPFLPQPYFDNVHDELCWMIDWREFFRAGVKAWERHLCGEMRKFHVVFRIRVRQGGRFVFWDDDSSIIRRRGEVIHRDTSAHMLQRHELLLEENDELEVAQWQINGAWQWGARCPLDPTEARDGDPWRRFLPQVQARLATPEGPPLKLYTNGAAPLRAIVAIYSLILHGYSPSAVLLYGSEQWSPDARARFAAALPFAETVSDGDVLRNIRAAGGQALVELARGHWWVKKTCVALFCPPQRFCLMDDDVLILERMDDALQAFQHHDLVFASDTDHWDIYRKAWGWIGRGASRPVTGRFNAGLYWMQVLDDPHWLGSAALRVAPRSTTAFGWEQGMIAALYAGRKALALPTNRYFYPLFDGMPGGVLGYDYAENPCGFASVHFGGLSEKPGDAAMRYLASDILRSKQPAGVLA